MKENILAFGFLILSISGNIKQCSSQADQPPTNGHVPDCEPEFETRRIYGVHLRQGVAMSEEYGVLPPDSTIERNRIVKLAEGIENTARSGHVYDLYETNNPATKSTVNAFLCGEANTYMLLEKTADAKYNKIRFNHYLTQGAVQALHANQQG